MSKQYLNIYVTSFIDGRIGLRKTKPVFDKGPTDNNWSSVKFVLDYPLDPEEFEVLITGGTVWL